MPRFSNPPHVIVSLDAICRLNELSSGTTKVLRAMLWLAGKDTSYSGMRRFQEQGIIILNPYLRRILLEKIGMKNSQSISNALTELVRNKVLIRLGSGAYRLNPELFEVGSWRIIEE